MYYISAATASYKEMQYCTCALFKRPYTKDFLFEVYRTPWLRVKTYSNERVYIKKTSGSLF